MRQSVFKKRIPVSGSKRTLEGLITVTMNNNVYSEYPLRAQHRLEFFIGNTMWNRLDNLYSEDDVLKAIEVMTGEFENHLKAIADLEAEKTFTDKLFESGFDLAHEKNL